jgi:membrane AbrB-like protein
LLIKWLALIALSVLLTLGLDYLELPASRFLGPLGAGIALALFNVRLTLNPNLQPVAQGLIGLLVGSSLNPKTLGVLGWAWPFMALGTFWSIGVSVGLGLVLSRLRILPESAAIWGLSPGAAGVMTIMSGDYGADARLVAFTQYLRVLIVSLVAVGVASQAIEPGLGVSRATVDYFPRILWPDALFALGALVAGLYLTKIFRVPGGLILLPLILGAGVENFLGASVAPPPSLMIVAYAVMGWRVGLTFDREMVAKTLRTLPAALLAISFLIAACGLFAVAMVVYGGFDPLTAYLASSPGGLDAVTIIATASGADLPMVMAMQSCRLFLVIVTAPYLARWISQKKFSRNSG